MSSCYLKYNKRTLKSQVLKWQELINTYKQQFNNKELHKEKTQKSTNKINSVSEEASVIGPWLPSCMALNPNMLTYYESKLYQLKVKRLNSTEKHIFTLVHSWRGWRGGPAARPCPSVWSSRSCCPGSGSRGHWRGSTRSWSRPGGREWSRPSRRTGRSRRTSDPLLCERRWGTRWSIWCRTQLQEVQRTLLETKVKNEMFFGLN